MGMRFRKSFKVAPGVKITLGKKSGSVSVGTKGAHHTVSTSGRRTSSVGIPGTGISYSSSSSSKKKGATSNNSFFELDDYSEYINPEYQSVLTEKEYAYYAKCTENGMLFDSDSSAMVTQSGKRNSITTYKVCYYIGLIISICLFLFGLLGFTYSIPFGVFFIVASLIIYLPIRGYKKIVNIHRKIVAYIAEDMK